MSANLEHENNGPNSRPLALAEPDIENNFESYCHLEVPLCTDPESRDPIIVDDNNILIQCDTLLDRLGVLLENEANHNLSCSTIETAEQEQSTSKINVPEKSNNEKSDNNIGRPYNSDNTEHDNYYYLPETSSSEDSDNPESLIRNETNDNEEEGIRSDNEDGEETKENRRRNRKARPGQWKRNETKKNRMEGKNYSGYKRSRLGVIKSGIPRQARKMGPPCESKMCQKSKKRHCQEFSEKERNSLFKPFWESMNWDQKRVYAMSLIKQSEKKRSSTDNELSRRNFSCEYYLYHKNDKKVVCRKMFLNTLGIKETMVRKWMNKADHGKMIASSDKWVKRRSQKNETNRKQILKDWLGSIPTMESHYCRKETSKKYVEQQFQSKAEVYRAYCKNREECGDTPLSNWTFYETFHELNLALYRPRKDQCDLCCSHEVGQVTDAEYQLHIERKDRARAEKEKDKQNAITDKNCYIFTMDLQAVKQCPVIPASALYFKTKLTVHNFTVYNLATHQCSNYWWHEGEGDLSASSFASLITNHLSQHCLDKSLPIVLYSDGCCYQNRNAVLANALLHYSTSNNVVITQKYLEKGHTEMECDSTHSIIERKLKNRKIHIPSDYIRLTEEARRKPCPLDAIYVTHDFFLNYADDSCKMYESIRPGKKAHDPTVTDIRVLKYENGSISYKLSFDDEFTELPIRKKKSSTNQPIVLNKLHAGKLKIPETKWKHLQILKKELPIDTHCFYDQLPYE